MTSQIILRLALLGVLYFAIALCTGAAMGILRELLLAPQFGKVAALLFELPIVLALLWYASRMIYFPATRNVYSLQGLVLSGGFALVTLLLAEWLIGILALGRTQEAILQHWGTTVGVIGLAAQILFGAFPALQGLLAQRSREHDY